VHGGRKAPAQAARREEGTEQAAQAGASQGRPQHKGHGRPHRGTAPHMHHEETGAAPDGTDRAKGFPPTTTVNSDHSGIFVFINAGVHGPYPQGPRVTSTPAETLSAARPQRHPSCSVIIQQRPSSCQCRVNGGQPPNSSLKSKQMEVEKLKKYGAGGSGRTSAKSMEYPNSTVPKQGVPKAP
jgi:hypothetical protein